MITIVALVGGFLVGAVTSYLVMRNNQSLKEKADKLSDAVDKKIK